MIYFTLILLPIYCYARDGRYECGPHGKFEYCIDGIPGCVVGCHCYPGYFFDTDTKICEPNTKLTQGFRRYYNNFPKHEHGASIEAAPPEPPEPPMPPMPPEPPEPAEPPERAGPASRAEPLKGSAELSDWLYNQFFKTIENQVINKTNEENLLQGTRRAGSPPTRKSNKKSGKKEKKGKKIMNHGLRRKLLKITEDDSMFESSSSSESDESSGSSSWENWDDPRDDSGGRGTDLPKAARKEKDHDHGHRKLVVYNKKPKPPLPSFIFLPNIETAFYPPMGLPAPAVPMMYPMIPIPPLLQECYEDHNNTAAGPQSTTTAATESTVPKEEETTTTTSSTTTTTTEATVINRKSNLKTLRGQNRNNHLQAIRQRDKSTQIVKKVGAMGKNFKISQKNHFIDPDDHRDTEPFMEDPYHQPYENLTPNRDDLLPIPDEIDFKYLSQLIHRVEGNTSGPTVPTIEFNPDRDGPKRLSRFWKQKALGRIGLQAPGRLQAPPPARRSLGAHAAPDDAYYTQLGRQIASLIRGLQPERAPPPPDPSDIAAQPFFAENGIAPSSYWERFVRSPVRLDYLHYQKDDNSTVAASKEQLYELEDQAEVAAQSSLVLSLSELENAIKMVADVRKQQIARVNQTNSKPSNKSFNVSLMPQAGGKVTGTPNVRKAPMMDEIDNFVKVKSYSVARDIHMAKKNSRKSSGQGLRHTNGNARVSNRSSINSTKTNNNFRKHVSPHNYNKIQSHVRGTRMPVLRYPPRIPSPAIIIPNNIDQYFLTNNVRHNLQRIFRGRTLHEKLNRPKLFFADFPFD